MVLTVTAPATRHRIKVPLAPEDPPVPPPPPPPIPPPEPPESGAGLYAWGGNFFGQLGLGDATDRSSPVQVGALTDWGAVFCGNSRFSVGVKTDGTLWVWGANDDGQLGLGDTVDRSSPVQLGAGTDWTTAIAVGRDHMLAVKSDGTLWAWGRNEGALGLGDLVARSSPVQVGSDSDWVAVAGNGGSANDDFSIAVKRNGDLYATGQNSNGQLGMGDTAARSSFTQVGSGWSTAVMTGVGHVAAVKSDGTLWTWGENGQGQLGLGDTTDRSSPVQVGAGTDWGTFFRQTPGNHTVASKQNGELWVWGFGSSGELGQGNLNNASSPVQVGAAEGWVKPAAGDATTGAVKDDGSLFMWGDNGRGKLGIGDTLDRSSPVQVGADTDWVQVSTGGGNGCTLAIKG